MANKEELVEQAKAAGVSGYSSMNKSELEAALASQDAGTPSGRRKDPVAEAYADLSKVELKNTHDESDAFHRHYIVPKDQYFGEDDHARYTNDVRQHCINRGLRPTGDVEFVGKEDWGSKSVRLDFKVPAVDAVTAEEFAVRHAHASQHDQKKMEAVLGGADGDIDRLNVPLDQVDLNEEGQ